MANSWATDGKNSHDASARARTPATSSIAWGLSDTVAGGCCCRTWRSSTKCSGSTKSRRSGKKAATSTNPSSSLKPNPPVYLARTANTQTGKQPTRKIQQSEHCLSRYSIQRTFYKDTQRKRVTRQTTRRTQRQQLQPRRTPKPNR